MKTIVTILFLIASTYYAYADIPVCAKELFLNSSDSLFIDTCANNTVYAKKNFIIRFNENFYPFNQVIQFGDTMTVADMRDDFPEIKLQLQQISDLLGNMHFVRIPAPYIDQPDSIQLEQPIFLFYLDEYQPADSIIVKLKSVDSVKDVTLIINDCPTMAIPKDRALINGIRFNKVYVQLGEVDDKFWENFKPYGFQTEIYQINCPMAWDITYGSQNVCLAIGDNTDNPNGIQHEELDQNHKALSNFGDSRILIEKEVLSTSNNHILNVASSSSSQKLEDNTTENNTSTKKQMVGAAPNCKFIMFNGLVYPGNISISKASDIDLDEKQDGILTTPDVQNFSIGITIKDVDHVGSVDNFNEVKDILDNGIIVVAAAGNQRNRMTSDENSNNIKKVDEKNYYFPGIIYPAAKVFQGENNNKDLDYKPITVAGLKPGKFIGLDQTTKDCIDLTHKELSFFNLQNQDIYNPHFTNKLQFADIYNFSPDTSKFNTSSTWNTRKLAKERAFVDLVAPSRYNLLAFPTSYYFGSGTSFATPLVSGIASLMVSVNKGVDTRLGVQGASVQRKAYNILTFTAKKISDGFNASNDFSNIAQNYNFGNNNLIESSLFNKGPNIDDFYQWEYLEQKNDPLRRWWAQRMGFGLVNAYRAVAHAIPNKGKELYTAEDNSSFTGTFTETSKSQEGYKLMHFGSFVNEGTDPYKFEIPISRGPSISNDGTLNVIEWGGASLPAAGTNYLPSSGYNNQGVTLLDDPDNDIELNVPDYCLLAIDGILKGMQATKNHKINTSGNGKILIEGYLEDVILEGNIKIGDLAVNSSLIKFSGAYQNEIYGKIELYNGTLLTDNSTTIMRPGSSIEMKYTGATQIPWINITNEGTLEMENETEIVNTGNIGNIGPHQNYVNVEINSKLVIKNRANVYINSRIYVQGELILEDSSKLYCREIIVSTGGKLTAHESAIVFGAKDQDGNKISGTGKIILLGGLNNNQENIGAEMQVLPNSDENAQAFYAMEGIEILDDNSNKGGAKLTVKSGATMVTGIIESEPSTTIEFEKGSKVYFYSNNKTDDMIPEYLPLKNVIKGNFYTGTNPTASTLRTEIYGFGYDQTENNNFNTLPKYNECDAVDKRFNWVKLQFDPQLNNIFDIWNYHFQIQNTDFYNVAIKTISPNPKIIDNCNFYTNSNICSSKVSQTNWNKDPINYFVECLPNIYPIGQFAFLITCGNISILNTRFIDEYTLNWGGNYSLYSRVGGISINFSESVNINNSELPQISGQPDDNSPFQFKNLKIAVNTENCDRVEITNSTFGFSNNASADKNSSVKLCNNLTYKVNIPQSLNNSRYWATYSNRFYSSNRSVKLVGVYSGQNYRGNLFSGTRTGIYMENSRANLGRPPGDPEIPPRIIAGANKIDNLTNTLSFPEMLQFDADIFFYGYEDLSNFGDRKPLNVTCGYNLLAILTDPTLPNQRYHLFYYHQYDAPNINVNVNVNNWRDDQNACNIYKNDDVTVDNITSCESVDISSSCEDTFEPVGAMSTCSLSQSGNICDYFVRNTGVWPSYTQTDTVLDNNFYAYLNDFCNGLLSCSCYKQRLFDLMQLAVLGDSSAEKLQMIISCDSTKMNDPAYTYLNCDPGNLSILLAEAYERIGKLDKALDEYYFVLSNGRSSSDTTLARWRILNLDAFLSDTSYGEVYDSLMAIYNDRVLHDINSVPSHTPPLSRMVIDEPEVVKNTQKVTEEPPLAILEQNVPNPFINETMIVFHLNREADVRLGVHDALGHTIKEVVNQRLRKGKYVYTFQNENLMSGVYLYLLTTDGKQIMKKMQLVK